MKTQLPSFIEKQLDGLPAPARAYALAKAAFETAEAQNFAEQKQALRQSTLDDPEPGVPPHEWTHPDWGAWYDRNKERVNAATDPIVARYPRELKKLYEMAEANLVDWAEECIKKHHPTDFSRVEKIFKAYRDGDLYGDTREKFIQICFKTPES